uniref:Putative secreted protein n=1 Tax=Anopheles darlingi TaxID=43151 RepID=A0A2M4DCA4_ANODA
MRAAARRPFLASFSCCCRSFTSPLSCSSRDRARSRSLRMFTVASSMSRSLFIWNCSKAHCRFVNEAWFF